MGTKWGKRRIYWVLRWGQPVQSMPSVPKSLDFIEIFCAHPVGKKNISATTRQQ